MQKQVLKDARGYILGSIEQRSDGTFVGKDARGYTKGFYDPKANKTKDSRGYAVGIGNLLSMLIMQK